MNDEKLPPFPVMGRTWSVDHCVPADLSFLPAILQGKKGYVRSGRTAIGCALVAGGIGPGDRVLVPSLHCPTMIEPVAAIGAVPIFYEINDDARLSVNLESISEGVERGASAILAAHYFGALQPRRVMETVKRSFPALQLVEDCAHLIYVDDRGDFVGRWADSVCFSLRKFFAVEDGGLWIGRRLKGRVPKLRRSFKGELRPAWRMVERWLADTSSRSRLGPTSLKAGGSSLSTAATTKACMGNKPDDGTGIGFAPESMSILSRVFMMAFSAGVRIRRRNWTIYEEVLAPAFDGDLCRPVLDAPPAVPYVFPVRVTHEPDQVYLRLKALGFPVLRWDATWPGMEKKPGSVRWRLAHEILQMPCHQGLTPPSVQRMASILVEEIRRVVA